MNTLPRGRCAGRVFPILLLALLLVGLAAPAARAGADRAAASAKLRALRDRIGKLTATIEARRRAHRAAFQRLREIEARLATARAAAAALATQLHGVQASLAELRTRREAAQRTAARARAVLAREVRASFALAHVDLAPLLFGASDTAAMVRLATYYRLVAEAREHHLKALRSEERALADIGRRTRARRRELAHLSAGYAVRVAALERDQRARRKLLKSLAAKISGAKQRLVQLRRNAQALRELVEGLERLADIPEQLKSAVPFGRRRGDLPWPADGRLVARFGAQRGGASLHWHGVLIAAPLGEPVRAVSHGRIAFAHWMRGFGNLIIIDHGDGYMSLYAHTETMLKQIGDWVDAGDVIARVGDTGGAARSALYFQIRHDGKPIDPLPWLHGAAPPPAAAPATLVPKG